MGMRELVASASRSVSGPSLLAPPSCCWMYASSRSAASATAAARFCSTWAFQVGVAGPRMANLGREMLGTFWVGVAGPRGVGAGLEGRCPDGEVSGVGKGKCGARRWAGLPCVRVPLPSGVGPSPSIKRLDLLACPPVGLWSFLWFVGFCFLTNQWQRTAPGPGTTQAGDAARAAIAFSFFSILSWVSAALGR